MKFIETPLNGAYLIEPELREDERGFFARTYCINEYQELLLDTTIVQVNNSLSLKKGTLRGMHYQVAPMQETKVIRCIRGALFDAIIDLRKDSPTYMNWYGATLSADNRLQMYVPHGFAHGFLSLTDNSEALYLSSQFYSSKHERGIRYNDDAFNILWPIDPMIISDKDFNHEPFKNE